MTIYLTSSFIFCAECLAQRTTHGRGWGRGGSAAILCWGTTRKNNTNGSALEASDRLSVTQPLRSWSWPPSPPGASGWHTCVGRCKFKFLSPTGFQKLRSCWRWGLKPDFSGNHYVRQPELISLGRGRDNWLPGPGRKWINKCAALVTFETIQSTWWPQQFKLESQEEREVRGQPLKLSKILRHTFGPSLFYLVWHRYRT